MYLLQILAGNARKVSAVRFERVNQDDATLETEEMTRLVPKIMKKKRGSDADPDKTDDNETQVMERAENLLSGDYVITEHVDKHDHQIKQ